MNREVQSEALEVVQMLAKNVPTHVDGRAAIVQMMDEGSKQWRQMEWIGFWFEHLVATKVTSKLGISVGPSIGRTRFDIVLSHVWDLKVHPQNSSSSTLILNDQEAVDRCVDEWGGFGFVVVSGDAVYDESGEFKAWHDDLKGGRSTYETRRIERGAPSRRRKTAFNPSRIEAVFLASRSDLARGLDEGWLGLFQAGMRNSNGVPRRPKYQIVLDKAPADVFAAQVTL